MLYSDAGCVGCHGYKKAQVLKRSEVYRSVIPVKEATLLQMNDSEHITIHRDSDVKTLPCSKDVQLTASNRDTTIYGLQGWYKFSII